MNFAALTLSIAGLWFLIVLGSIVLTIMVEGVETLSGATWGFLVFLILAMVIGHVPVVSFITGHTVRFLCLLLLYVLTGSVYCVFKWTSFVYRRREEAVNNKYADKKPPKVADNKSNIIMWMAYWPFSLWWTLLNDPIKRIFNIVYAYMAGFLQKISDRAFAGIKEA